MQAGVLQSLFGMEAPKGLLNERPNGSRANKSGIFFSIWTNEASARKNRANYNVHALKLRQLEGYAITSREFANDFRNRFASMRNTWPNVSMDYGPMTLMQGWIEAESGSFEKDILVLMERFKHLSPLLDRLLRSRER
jgi:hypothetical protein